mgnify:CR=1 FL=1
MPNTLPYFLIQLKYVVVYVIILNTMCVCVFTGRCWFEDSFENVCNRITGDSVLHTLVRGTFYSAYLTNCNSSLCVHWYISFNVTTHYVLYYFY